MPASTENEVFDTTLPTVVSIITLPPDITACTLQSVPALLSCTHVSPGAFDSKAYPKPFQASSPAPVLASVPFVVHA